MGITGNLQLGSGGGVTDISDAYTVANSGVTITNSDSPYTVTDTGSVIVYVDSSGGAVTINPNASPSTDDRLKVIDVGGDAGTNNITVTALDVISQDKGSKEWRYNGAAWELMEATGGFELVGTAATAAALESAYAAADYAGRWGIVAGTTSANGGYQSDGSSWVKKWDEIGDPTDMPSWAGGIAYTGSNRLTDSGTSFGRNSTDTANMTYVDGDETRICDGLTNARVLPDSLPALFYKTFTTTLPAMGEFILDSGPSNTANSNISEFEIIGRTSGGTIDTLTPLSVSRSGAGSVALVAGTNGNSKIQLTGDTVDNERITVNTNNTTAYDGYGIRAIVGGNIYFTFGEIEARETVDNTALITATSELKQLHAGYSKNTEGTAITADTLLDNDNYIVELDASGGDFTMTLPAVATVKTGKRYLFVNTSTGVVTLAGDTAETINGSNTNNSLLASAEDWAEIINNGTEWKIINQSLSAAKVDAEGAVMNSDTTTASMSFVIDEDNMVSDSATKVPTQQSVKAFGDNIAKGEAVVSTAVTSTAASVATDASLGESFTHTTTENTTLANPTNLKAGKTYTWTITQDATTPYTMAYGSAFKFSGGTAPTLTAVASAVDVLTGISDGTNIYCNFLADVK